MRASLAALALALAACVERPTPADTDDTSTTATTAPATSTSPTTTGTDEDGVGAACKPAESETCSMGQFCCSDDPATVGGKIPNYYMDGVNNEIYGTPLFSDFNNALSSWGHCIETGGFQSPLVNGCPVPCNPTWDQSRIAEICGTAICCPFTAVDPVKDCILDPDSGRWRTVRGADIIAKRTGWGPAHTTNQDPFAEGCKIFSGNDQDSLNDCITQLGVADQRGFCYSLDCPCVEDVCDMKNPDWVPRCS